MSSAARDALPEAPTELAKLSKMMRYSSPEALFENVRATRTRFGRDSTGCSIGRSGPG